MKISHILILSFLWTIEKAFPFCAKNMMQSICIDTVTYTQFPKEEEEGEYRSTTLQIPFITGLSDATLEHKINTHIHDFLQEHALTIFGPGFCIPFSSKDENFAKCMTQRYQKKRDLSQKENRSPRPAMIEEMMEVTVTLVSSLICLEVNLFIQSSELAHPNNKRKFLVLDMKSGNLIRTLSDFLSQEGQELVTTQVGEKLQEAHRNDLYPLSSPKLRALLDCHTFHFTQQDLVFVFSPYEVASRVMGCIEIKIPLTTISEYILHDSPVCSLRYFTDRDRCIKD